MNVTQIYKTVKSIVNSMKQRSHNENECPGKATITKQPLKLIRTCGVMKLNLHS